MLTQFDMLKGFPYPSNPSGWYYWTSVLYVDSDDFDNQSQMILAVLGRERLCSRENIHYWGYRIKQPPGRGNVVLTASFTGTGTGSLPAIADPQILCIARWTLADSFGHKTYRLVRYPIGTSEIEGDRLTPAGLLRQQTSINTFLATNIFRNKYGRVLETGAASPRVHMWQLRHGTKRSRSRFWLP